MVPIWICRKTYSSVIYTSIRVHSEIRLIERVHVSNLVRKCLDGRLVCPGLTQQLTANQSLFEYLLSVSEYIYQNLTSIWRHDFKAVSCRRGIKCVLSVLQISNDLAHAKVLSFTQKSNLKHFIRYSFPN